MRSAADVLAVSKAVRGSHKADTEIDPRKDGSSEPANGDTIGISAEL